MIGRVFRIVRTPLTLLALLALLGYGAWWGWQNILAPTPEFKPPPCVTQEVPKGTLKSSQVTVRVYNGGTKRGLAGDIGTKLQAKGFRVVSTSNTEEKVTGTQIVTGDAKDPQALLLQSFFKGSKIKADKRTDGTVDVMVGSKDPRFNSKAKTSIVVETEKVCLPASSTPTAGN